jgi:hypothetical protein
MARRDETSSDGWERIDTSRRADPINTKPVCMSRGHVEE